MTTAQTSPRITLRPGVDICQRDLPIDWYQDEFRPYAEEYLALPDRTPETVMPWLDRYVRPAIEAFGPSLLLAAHFYMGGEIVKLVERYGGHIGDSYALATIAARTPKAEVIVQSAVHFMAEAIALLAEPHQQVFITNPKAGCTMEMLARGHMVDPIATRLIERYGDDLTVVAYMNTSGRLKALAGQTGGATCTSSNAHLVLDWARRKTRRVLFIPDRHLGENAAAKVGVPPDRITTLPAPRGYNQPIELRDLASLDKADLILWGAHCGVHTVFEPAHVHAWRTRGYTVLVHPECARAVAECADGQGSTSQLWDRVMRAPSGSRFAVGTEGHFVRNLKEQASLRGIHVEHLGDVPEPWAVWTNGGCGCATMSRNDPPHLAGMLDLLRKGVAPDLNRVLPGDTIDETSGIRDRIPDAARTELVHHARDAVRRMIEITESVRRDKMVSL